MTMTATTSKRGMDVLDIMLIEGFADTVTRLSLCGPC